MSFFTFEQLHKTLTIQNKRRIALIVPYAYNQVVIFYQDGCYDHRNIFDNTILHQDKLQFIPTKWIRCQQDTSKSSSKDQHQSQRSNCQLICLIGEKGQQTYYCILNISSKLYKPYQQCFVSTKTLSESIAHYLVPSSATGYYYFVEISMNIQNGVLIRCYDFRRNQWLDEQLHLGQRFFQYIFVNMPSDLIIDQRQARTSFCMIANGQKGQAVHIACISISQPHQKIQPIAQGHDPSQESLISTQSQTSTIQFSPYMQLISTKQVKYIRNFTILGCHFQSSGHLFLIGNSTQFQTKQKIALQWQPTCLYLNFYNLMANVDSQYKFLDMKGFKIGKEIIIRQYLGYFEKSMLFIVQSPLKRSLHRLIPSKILEKNMNFDQQAYSFPSYGSTALEISLDLNSIFNYQLICQQFFQKIKDSPSLIKLKLLLKISKKSYYKQMLQTLLEQAKTSQSLVKTVLSCF